MKKTNTTKSYLHILCFSMFLPLISAGQCDIFKSEINGVKQYSEDVSKTADQVQTYSENAAFAATYKEARTHAHKAKIYAGEILGAAYEAVDLAAEAQHYSVSCTKEEVESYAIDAERFAIDARDYADEAYTNAKKANSARNLGDVRYFMRKSLDAAKEAKRSADAAVYAASDALYSCDHETVSAGGNE